MPTSVRQATLASQVYPDPIPNIIRFGSVNLWSGASGVGKTIMLAEWFARLRDGRTIWGKETNRPTQFCVIAADRDWSTYAEAFADAGFPDSELNRYVLAEDDTEDPRKWIGKSPVAFDLFKRCLDKIDPPPGALLWVDPLSPLFIAGDQNKPVNCAATLLWIRRCGRQREITQILSSNTIKISADPKEGYRRSRDNISGSGALVAYSDTSIYIDPPAEKKDPTILGWAPRRAAEETFQCQFDPETRLFIPFTGLTAEGQTAATDRPTQLLKLIPDEGISRGDLEELAIDRFKVVRSTVGEDLKKLKARKLIQWDAWGRISRRKVN